MKVAIIGTLPSTTSYNAWVTVFQRHLLKEPISEIGISDGDTLLNLYARTYANAVAITVNVYATVGSKLARNIALIEDADLVVAFTTGAATQSIQVKNQDSTGKKVIIINMDEQVTIPPI